jgi:hypothetical protein
MSSSPRDQQRAILIHAVRGLVAAARSERARLPENSPTRSFYLGVDAAAQEVLHPELGSSRRDDWLDLETPAFREGYQRTSIRLATVMSAAEPPLRLPLPDATGVG